MKEKNLAFLENHPVYFFDTVDSTNNILKEMARNGAPTGSCIVAKHQIAGRGRLGRSFHSPKDTGLYFSILYRPDVAHLDLLTITPCAAVAAAKAIESCCGVSPNIKWVNDLYLKDKKIAGILAESLIDQADKRAIVLGIGINLWEPVDGFPKSLSEIAGSIFGQTEPDTQLLHHLLKQLIHHLDPLPMDGAVMDDYRKRSMVIGKEVQLTGVGITPLTGIVEDIDNKGALVLNSNGKIVHINSGEISLRIETPIQ